MGETPTFEMCGETGNHRHQRLEVLGEIKPMEVESNRRSRAGASVSSGTKGAAGAGGDAGGAASVAAIPGFRGFVFGSGAAGENIPKENAIDFGNGR